MLYLKREGRRDSSLAESFTTDEWREFYCLHNYSCCCFKNWWELFWWRPCLFCKRLRSFEGDKN